MQIHQTKLTKINLNVRRFENNNYNSEREKKCKRLCQQNRHTNAPYLEVKEQFTVG